jgi:HEAT repeat protein
MNLDCLMEPAREISECEVSTPKARRMQTGVRSLIAMVGCCGIVFWAARHLWENGHPALVAARGLTAGSASERIDAIRLIVEVGVQDSGVAIPALIAALADPEVEIRVEAADALKLVAFEAISTGTAPDAVRSAIAALNGSLNDPHRAVRIASANSLTYIITAKAPAGVADLRALVAAFSALLDDRDDTVRLAALAGLASCGSDGSTTPPGALLAKLSDGSPIVRAAAVSSLAHFQCVLDPWLPFLLKSLAQDEPQVRDACASAMFRQKPPAVSAAAIPALITALGSHARNVRHHAAKALEPHVRDPRALIAIPALLALLREPIYVDQGDSRSADTFNADPAEEAAYLLGEIAPGVSSADKVIVALSNVVRSGHPPRTRRASWSLAQFGAAAAPTIPLRIKSLRETDPFLLSDGNVISALGRLGPGTASADEIVAALTETALQSESPTVRIVAIRVLPRFGRDAAIAIPVLRALQKDPDSSVSSSATTALASLDPAK